MDWNPLRRNSEVRIVVWFTKPSLQQLAETGSSAMFDVCERLVPELRLYRIALCVATKANRNSLNKAKQLLGQCQKFPSHGSPLCS